MKREDLAHIIRAAAAVTDDARILVIGSQAILATFNEAELPPEATASLEADLAFISDENEEKADQVDGAIGEASRFHQSFGYYGQGVGLATATLPAGWEDRLVPFEWGDTGVAEAVCLDPHDLVIAKLVAGREKDFDFAAALLERGQVEAATLLLRAEDLPVPGAVQRRIRNFIQRRLP
ncbi:MAG: DUF6036 family nucleotidyltransferase [Acidimicrobiia bacterium]